MYRTNTLKRDCPSCGKLGTMTFEEDDQEGRSTRWIGADGTWTIDVEGAVICKCGYEFARP